MPAAASAAAPEVGEQLAVSDSGEFEEAEEEQQLFLSSVDSDRGRRLPTRRLVALSLVMAQETILKMQ